MATVVRFDKPLPTGVACRWTTIKDYEKTEDGQWISLVRGENRDGSTCYGVLINAADQEQPDAFDIIVEYRGDLAGRAAAEAAAEIADRTLGASCGLLPEPEPAPA